MLAFYASERCDGCVLEEDGDMLLFQWGTYNWGDSTHFELNITRQLMPGGEDGDGGFRQVGQHLDGQLPEHLRAEDEQQEAERQHERPVPERKADEGVKHGARSPAF